jgi:hypothetical protein
MPISIQLWDMIFQSVGIGISMVCVLIKPAKLIFWSEFRDCMGMSIEKASSADANPEGIRKLINIRNRVAILKARFIFFIRFPRDLSIY